MLASYTVPQTANVAFTSHLLVNLSYPGVWTYIFLLQAINFTNMQELTQENQFSQRTHVCIM